MAQPFGAEQLPAWDDLPDMQPHIVAVSAETTVPEMGPTVNIAERAAALLDAQSLINQASSKRGLSVAALYDVGLQSRLQTDPVAVSTNTKKRENALLLAARQRFVEACGYTALVDAGMMRRQDATDAEVDEWFSFRTDRRPKRVDTWRAIVEEHSGN